MQERNNDMPVSVFQKQPNCLLVMKFLKDTSAGYFYRIKSLNLHFHAVFSPLDKCGVQLKQSCSALTVLLPCRKKNGSAPQLANFGLTIARKVFVRCFSLCRRDVLAKQGSFWRSLNCAQIHSWHNVLIWRLILSTALFNKHMDMITDG